MKVSLYMSAATQRRARATFRGTAHLEGDETFSEFVEKAVITELARREREHNAGEPYPGGDRKLPPGRR